MLPESMADVIHAPLPFIAGMNTRTLERLKESNFPDDIVVASVDENLIGSHEAVPRLPGLVKLEDQLNQHLKVFHMEEKDSSSLPWPVESARMEIRKRFFTFFVELLLKYHDCIVFPKLNMDSAMLVEQVQFNIPLFLSRTVSIYHPFYRKFFGTQMFMKFIEDRLEENSSGVKYFDSQIDERKSRSSSGELLLASKQKRLSAAVKTVKSYSVNMEGLDDSSTFNYESIPILNRNLLAPLRKDLKMTILSPKIAEKQAIRRRSGKYKKTSMANEGKVYFGNSSSSLLGFKEILRSYYACWIFLFCHTATKPSFNVLQATIQRAHRHDKLTLDTFVYEWIMKLFTLHRAKNEAAWLAAEMKSMNAKLSAKMYGMFMDMLSSPSTKPSNSTDKKWIFEDPLDFSSFSIKIDAKCHSCERLFSENYILCDWVCDDSDSCEVCCFSCGQTSSPCLSILQSDGEALRVPFLKPSIIEVELELQMSSGTLNNLDKKEMMLHHPILFWNLLWIFTVMQFDFYECSHPFSNASLDHGGSFAPFIMAVSDLRRFLLRHPRIDRQVCIMSKLASHAALLVEKKIPREQICHELMRMYFALSPLENEYPYGCHFTIASIVAKLGLFKNEAEWDSLYEKLISTDFATCVGKRDFLPSDLQRQVFSTFHHLRIF